MNPHTVWFSELWHPHQSRWHNVRAAVRRHRALCELGVPSLPIHFDHLDEGEGK